MAIVGSRNATPEARNFASDLARALAREGAVIVSGGAHGIDAAAHEGALAVGGRTWAIAGTGQRHCYPSAHADLYEAIGRGPGAMVWPFADDQHSRSAFLVRNRVLVALSDLVVVVQAGLPSGALHAAGCARSFGRPLWVVPAAPWMTAFSGSCRLLADGARPLTSIGHLLGVLGLAPPSPASSSVISSDLPQEPAAVPPSLPRAAVALALSSSESRVLDALSTTPQHLDAIARSASLAAPATSAALLTLALEDVVVEGPPGFFRRRDSRNH